MRHIAAYLLASLGGNDSPSAQDIQNILGSMGIDADQEQLDKVVSELSGKSVEDVIAQGMSKLASMPAGGAVAVSARSGSDSAGSANAAPAEAKKEAVQEKEESDEDMGFGLFD